MPPRSTKPRILPVFGLTLLEVLRDQDSPNEVLEDENVSVTMPRKLGLSDVVDKQIRIYRDMVKQRIRRSDDEVRDLDEIWDLPAGAEKPEGMAALGDGRVLVALDTGSTRGNGMIVARPD